MKNCDFDFADLKDLYTELSSPDGHRYHWYGPGVLTNKPPLRSSKERAFITGIVKDIFQMAEVRRFEKGETDDNDNL
jgi:hypothetical protein